MNSISLLGFVTVFAESENCLPAPEYHTRYVVGSIHYFKFVLKILPGSGVILIQMYMYIICYAMRLSTWSFVRYVL